MDAEQIRDLAHIDNLLDAISLGEETGFCAKPTSGV
jgi:hypothetical protein